jgi:hypothetical protein
VPNGPSDLDTVVAHAARIVGVPAEQRQVLLDELAVHEADCRLVHQLLTASLESRHNGMRATSSVSTTEEAAAALGGTVSSLHHDGDGLYVEMLAATGVIRTAMERGAGADLPATGVATASPFGSAPSRTLWR